MPDEVQEPLQEALGIDVGLRNVVVGERSGEEVEIVHVRRQRRERGRLIQFRPQLSRHQPLLPEYDRLKCWVESVPSPRALRHEIRVLSPGGLAATVRTKV